MLKKLKKREGLRMRKRKASILIVFLLIMFAFGCASRDYVRQQVDPLLDCCRKAQQKCEKAFELQQMK
jgi:hypothetical protein